jgi:DNA polymerase-3 subunit epsilon
MTADEWVVLDLETTGLSPTLDRIVEIGLVRVSPDRGETDSWTTVLNPDRDMGPTHIHGLTARDAVGAPRFADVALDFVGHLGNAHLAAHNARFDVGFVTAELARMGINWGPPDCLCTMSLPYQLGVVHSRGLTDCCAELGIPLTNHHTALDDARAASQLLLMTLARTGTSMPLPELTPLWPPQFPPGVVAHRGDPGPGRNRGTLATMASQLGVPDGIDTPHDVALAYLGLLDRVMEDRQVSDQEVAALAEFATTHGIDRGDAEELHSSYLEGLANRAWADGTLTDAEQRDLETVAELLNTPLDDARYRHQHDGRSTVPTDVVMGERQPTELLGKSVCFTGESVCSIKGSRLSRGDQESLARRAGLTVKAGVSGKLDLLVLADPDSMSGKARKAAELGVRRVAESVFWHLAGVPVD